MTVVLLLAVVLALKRSPVVTQVIGIALAQFVAGALVFGPILFYILIRLSGISLSASLSCDGSAGCCGCLIRCRTWDFGKRPTSRHETNGSSRRRCAGRRPCSDSCLVGL